VAEKRDRSPCGSVFATKCKQIANVQAAPDPMRYATV